MEILQLREEISSLLDEDSNAAINPEIIQLLEQALVKYPNSPSLYCMLGDAIQLGGESRVCGGDAAQCYLRAIEVDPLFAEAYESLGFLSHVAENGNAKDWFERSLRISTRIESHVGLAMHYTESCDFAAAARKLAEASDVCSGLASQIERCETDLNEANRENESAGSKDPMRDG